MNFDTVTGVTWTGPDRYDPARLGLSGVQKPEEPKAPEKRVQSQKATDEFKVALPSAMSSPEPMAAALTNRVQQVEMLPGTGIKETTPQREVAVGTPQQVIEQTEEKQLTPEQYNANLLRLSNQLIAERQKVYDEKQARKAQMANTSGIVTGKMGRTIVAGNNPNVSKSTLDTIEKVLDVVHGERADSISPDEWALFNQHMTRQGDMLKKGHKTSATNDMERTLFNTQRIIANEVQQGKMRVASALESAEKPKNMTEWNNLIEKSFPGIAKQIGSVESFQMMPEELRVAGNLDQANFPHFNRWLQDKGVNPVTWDEFQKDDFIRKKYEQEFMADNPYYSYHLEAGKIFQNVPTSGKLKEDDGERVSSIKTNAELGRADITDPLAAKVYGLYNAGNSIKFLNEDKEFNPDSLVVGRLTGKSARVIGDRAIESAGKIAIDAYDSGKSIGESIRMAINEAKRSGSVTGLDSPDAVKATASNIRMVMSQHYNEVKKKAETAIAEERAVDDESLNKRLFKVVNKQYVPADIWDYQDRSESVRRLYYDDGKISDDELRDYAKEIISTTLNLDPSTRQGQRLDRALSMSTDDMGREEPRIRDVVDKIFQGLSADRGKIMVQEAELIEKRKREDKLRTYEAMSKFPGLTKDFVIFDKDNNAVAGLNSGYAESLRLKEAFENPRLSDDVKDDIARFAGSHLDPLSQKSVIGRDANSIENAVIMSSIFSGNEADISKAGLIDETVKNEFNDLPIATQDKNTRAVTTTEPKKYWDKATPEQRALWKSGQVHELDPATYEKGNMEKKAAYVMMRNQWIRGTGEEINVASLDALRSLNQIASRIGIPPSNTKDKTLKQVSGLIRKTISDNPDAASSLDGNYIRLVNSSIKVAEDKINDLKKSGALPDKANKNLLELEKNVEAFKELRKFLGAFERPFYPSFETLPMP